jgi:hypothetical protein
MILKIKTFFLIMIFKKDLKKSFFKYLADAFVG